ncbi:Na/Pi cotransporter family protein [Oceanospirillum linum]|uniref:Sodium:phosphate symporter n=1 Tax=Oceanospirillum linum TaxID=966 RepID=A0A1T1HEE4_OCELI|nr:Na/Pi symporter [Oceanospirillum linum]OOV88219.1 sodium:phosphate symporter [Oceanospirillum linum]SEF48474.1 phosphate:Na+ symporter [Oleiphilus messinensis]SMP02970.1 phosphate:Na+ symporter [Oceanospirillum linum]
MFRQLILPTIFLVLGYGFWISPDFKEIAAGVAVFLFGMLSLEEGFKAFTGGLLEKLLKRTTNKLWKSLSFGVISTTLMQSSSLVSVITISFLSAGLISLTAGVGIIFGANLGTTTGAWLVAGLGLKVKISAYAMPMLVFGILLIFQKSKELKGIGYVLAGLGFLFLGIHYMKEGFEAFKDTLDLTAYAVRGYPGVFLFTLIGLFATVIMQSSHATLVLIITALSAQQITYENALALAIGANIGTTITAIIGSLSANIEGRRLAVAHLIFNTVTGFVAILFIYQLTMAVDSISYFVGIEADNYTLKLAVFHTIFNSIGVILMLPVIPSMVRFLERRLKAKETSRRSAPKYLSQSASDLPEAMLAAVRQETQHLYDNAASIIAGGLSLPLNAIHSNKSLEDVIFNARTVIPTNIDQQYEESVKSLYADIVDFSSSYQGELSADQVEELFRLRAAGRDIVEAIKDTKHLQKNLSRYFIADNPYIHHEYNTLRMRLASVLRELHKVRQKSENDSATILSLDRLRLDMEEYDQNLNHNLSSLIRQKLISGPMSVSLMNDSGYASDVTRKLVQMGEVLFSESDLRTKSIEQSLSLSDEELTEMMHSQHNNGKDRSIL